MFVELFHWAAGEICYLGEVSQANDIDLETFDVLCLTVFNGNALKIDFK